MRYLALISLCAMTSCYAMENAVMLWSMHNLLLKPHTPTDMIPNYLVPSVLDPKVLEKELIAAVNATPYTNGSIAQHPGTSLPPAMKAWLLGQENGESMKQRARNGIATIIPGYWPTDIAHRQFLSLVIGAAFSPKSAASHLRPVESIVALARACKAHGSTAALVLNHHSESFAEVKQQHQQVVSLFNHLFISAQRKLLTMDPRFFEGIKAELGSEHRYVYIDVTEGTGAESLEAARQAGMNTIEVTSYEKLATDLREQKLLS